MYAYDIPDSEREGIVPNLRIAAEQPWMGLTAWIGGQPHLVVGKVSDNVFVVENQFGQQREVDFLFDWDMPTVETNRLVAASRIASSPFNDAGLLFYDRDSGEWIVRDGISDLPFELTAAVEALEQNGWRLAAPDFDKHDVVVPVAGRCPNCGSDSLSYAEDEEDGPTSSILDGEPVTASADDPIVLCQSCHHWCRESELKTDDEGAGGNQQREEAEESDDKQASIRLAGTIEIPYPDGAGIHNGTSAAFKMAGLDATITVPGAPKTISLPFNAPNEFILVKMCQHQGLLNPGQLIRVHSDNPDLAARLIELNAHSQQPVVSKTAEYGKADDNDAANQTGDRPKEAIKCPKCDSHTVEAVTVDEDEGKAEFLCLTCGNMFNAEYRKTAGAEHPKGTRIEMIHPSKKGIKGSIVDHAGVDDNFGDHQYDLILDNGDEMKKVPEIHFKKIKSASMLKGAPYPENSYKNAPDHTPKGQKEWPEEVNAIYNACVREGHGEEGEAPESLKTKCARIAWAKYKENGGHPKDSDKNKKSSVTLPEDVLTGVDGGRWGSGYEGHPVMCYMCGNQRGAKLGSSCEHCGYPLMIRRDGPPFEDNTVWAKSSADEGGGPKKVSPGLPGPVILPFHDPSAANTDLVGGKGANLASLTQSGFPVPPGFSIPAYVFEAFVPDPQHLIDLVKNEDYEGAQQYVLSFNTPHQDILHAFDHLGFKEVAVRSSAVAEDSAEASYAGRQATLLNQTRDGGSHSGDYGVIDAVKHCWASFFTEMAASYRSKVGSLDDLAMAVVVQAMVPAQSAGTAFTQDPSLPEGHMLVKANTVNVAAVPGLGEQLVSGEMTPDTYRIDRHEGRVVNVDIVNGGVLSAQHVTDLAHLALQLEDHFEAPQDIEWAIHNGQVHLLQSRPITT